MNKDDEKRNLKIEALVTVDERGQMVLPKEIRDRLGIEAGDKLAIVAWEKDGKTCCITLIPTAELISGISSFLDSVMGKRYSKITEEVR